MESQNCFGLSITPQGPITEGLGGYDFIKNADLIEVKRLPWFRAISLGDKVIGSLTLDKAEGAQSCRAELGYVLAKKYWGKGYTTQAIKMARETGCEDLDVIRIEAYVDPNNIGSQKALERNGFVREALLKKFVLQKGEVRDRYIYAYVKTSTIRD